VLVDGKPPGAAHGADVDEAGNGTVSEQRLYQLIRVSPPIVEREFTSSFSTGAEAFDSPRLERLCRCVNEES